MPEPRFFLLLGGIGAAIGLVCLLVPFIARPLYHVWYALAACIGIVMANLIFALLFYGIFTPMGLFMRLIGRDALNLKWRKGTATLLDGRAARAASRRTTSASIRTPTDPPCQAPTTNLKKPPNGSRATSSRSSSAS